MTLALSLAINESCENLLHIYTNIVATNPSPFPNTVPLSMEDTG